VNAGDLVVVAAAACWRDVVRWWKTPPPPCDPTVVVSQERLALRAALQALRVQNRDYRFTVRRDRLAHAVAALRDENANLRRRAYIAPYVQAGYLRLVEREIATRAIADRCDKNVARWLNADYAHRNAEPFGTVPVVHTERNAS
jgi:hypothetical protein